MKTLCGDLIYSFSVLLFIPLPFQEYASTVLIYRLISAIAGNIEAMT